MLPVVEKQHTCPGLFRITPGSSQYPPVSKVPPKKEIRQTCFKDILVFVVDLNVFPHNPGLSDHHFITFAIATNNLLRPQPRSIKSRAINSQTTQRFLDALPDSLCLLKDVRGQTSVNHLNEELNLTLRNTLDAVAPLKT